MRITWACVPLKGEKTKKITKQFKKRGNQPIIVQTKKLCLWIVDVDIVPIIM